MKLVLTDEQRVAREQRRLDALAELKALPVEQQIWHARLEALGACEPALRFARRFADTIDGAVQAWTECRVVEKDPKTGKDVDLAAKWMGWLCMRTIDQYGVMEAESFRIVNSAETVMAGLIKVVN